MRLQRLAKLFTILNWLSIYYSSNIFDENGCRFGTCRLNHDFSHDQPSTILRQFKIDPYQDFEELVDLLQDRVNAQFDTHREDEEYEEQHDAGSYYDNNLGPGLRFPSDDVEDEEDDDDDDALSSVSSTSQSR